MNRIFSASIEKKQNLPSGRNQSVGASFSSRYIHIVTDSLQSAYAIARTKCASDEEVVSVSLNSAEDVYVDKSVLTGED